MAGLLRVPHYRHSAGAEDGCKRPTGPEEGIDNLLLVPESVLDMDGNQLRDDLNGLRFAFRKQYLQADLGPRGNIWICKIYVYTSVIVCRIKIAILHLGCLGNLKIVRRQFGKIGRNFKSPYCNDKIVYKVKT